MRGGARLWLAAACGLAAAAGFRAGSPGPGAIRSFGGPSERAEPGIGSAPGFFEAAAPAGEAASERHPGGSGPAAAGRAGAFGRGGPGEAPAAGLRAGIMARLHAADRREEASGDPSGVDREAPGGSGGVIRLDGLEAAPDAVSTAPQGFDPAGPRALVLWRVVDGGAVRLADGFSDSTGALHFPQVSIPEDSLALVVSPAGAPPPSHDTSDPVWAAGRAPLPPVVEEVSADAGQLVLRVGAREPAGAVLVVSGDGSLLGRFALPAPSAPAPRTLEIGVEEGAGKNGLWVAQELPDGRLSPLEPVTVPAAAKGSGGAP